MIANKHNCKKFSFSNEQISYSLFLTACVQLLRALKIGMRKLNIFARKCHKKFHEIFQRFNDYSLCENNCYQFFAKKKKRKKNLNQRHSFILIPKNYYQRFTTIDSEKMGTKDPSNALNCNVHFASSFMQKKNRSAKNKSKEKNV